jgi:osmoprotectant transport system permease protein
MSRRRPPLSPKVGVALLATLMLSSCADDERKVVIGSKKFTESVIMGEAAALLGQSVGVTVEHRAELGGTRVLFEALKRGDLDLYPEYTGTIAAELLPDTFSDEKRHGGLTPAAIREALKPLGLDATAPLAFNNTYGLAVRKDVAAVRGLTRISQLADHADLRIACGHEFLDRDDGWPGLREAYQLPFRPRGLDHDLAYRGIAAGDLDVVDVYTTDAEIAELDLVVLEDDQRFFPEYRALYVVRRDLKERAPKLMTALGELGGSITSREMSSLNGMAKLDKQPTVAVAGKLLQAAGVDTETLDVDSRRADRAENLLGWLLEHLVLVAISLLMAIVVAIPLGILAARSASVGQVVLGVTGVLQTVPSLALLVFMIPLVGIGAPGAIIALFLYSLLPIVRNTHSGLTGIDPGLVRSADALGLSARTRLFRVELPLALPAVLAGVKTAAVINVGTATLGALIGAGGLGKPILTGIRMADDALILTGALPAAALALAVQGLRAGRAGGGRAAPARQARRQLSRHRDVAHHHTHRSDTRSTACFLPDGRQKAPQRHRTSAPPGLTGSAC